MKINVLNLLLENEKEIEVKLEKVIKDDKFKDERFEVLSPVDVYGKLTFHDEIVRFDGSLNCTCHFVCDRCLEQFVCDIETDFYEEFKAGVSDMDEDFMPIVNDTVDLESSVVKNILLNIPIKLLCDENCEGITYDMGIDEEEEVKNSPFSILKNLKIGETE